MGNYKFKLSDMIPNAWFYKLKDMGKTRKQSQTQSRKKKQASQVSTTNPSKPKQQPLQCNPRKSYYFTREVNPNERINTSPANNPKDTNSPEPPRKSSKQRLKRRTRTKTYSCSSSPKLVVTENSSYSPHDNNSPAESEYPDPEFRTDRVLLTESPETVPCSNTCGCKLHSNTNDIIIDVINNSIVRKDDKLQRYDEYDDSFSNLALPPIVTKPAKFNDLLSDAKKKETKQRNNKTASHEEEEEDKEKKTNLEGTLKVKIVKEQRNNNTGRRLSVTSPGLRLRLNSPRIASRKIQTHGRKSTSSTGRRSLSDSFAIVKSSLNPQRDFRESMVEMIVENNIRTSKDLEDLLACYLSLNSDEYHDLIIKVFKQIWFDLTDN